MQLAIKQHQLSNKAMWAVGAALALAGTLAMAGTTGTEFQILYTLVTDWMGGWLGRALALASVLLGVITGMVRGTLIPALVGFAVAVMLFVAPNVINGILAAPI
jgi:conjugal transfer pilus assembly protein TraA